MSKGIEVVKSIWLGKKFISIGMTKIDGNEIHFKKFGGIPGMNPFIPIMANAKSIPFQERNIWIPNIGDTGDKLRMYMADLRLDKYFAMINPQDIHAIQHLKNENESLHQLIEKLFTMLYEHSKSKPSNILSRQANEL